MKTEGKNKEIKPLLSINRDFSLNKTLSKAKIRIIYKIKRFQIARFVRKIYLNNKIT